MNCAIINQDTQTIIGRDGSEAIDNAKVSGSALQNPDISRMTLNALMRRQFSARTGTSRSFWAHFLTRNVIANHNTADTATS